MGYYKTHLFALIRRVMGNNPMFIPNRQTHRIPFLDFYESTTGQPLGEYTFKKIQKKVPKLEELTAENLIKVGQVLENHGMSPVDVCANPDLLTMHPITIDNRVKVLRESGFPVVLPLHIVKYHTLVRERTIKKLKTENFIPSDLNLEEHILKYFKTWPPSHRIEQTMPEDSTCVLKVRVGILRKFLNWRLGLADKEFEKYCRVYLMLKHRSMANIQEAIDIAQHEINFSPANIKRNGFLISADTTNTKEILRNVPELAGVDIRQIIRLVPAIIKNNHTAIIRIRDILEEYRIPEDSQRRCFTVYCMKPETVEERLAQLSTMKEFNVLSSNPRALHMVVHHKKMLGRLSLLHTTNKTCYSLNNLLSSQRKFEDYLNNFGSQTCARDLAIVICSSLDVDYHKYIAPSFSLKTPAVKRNVSGESIISIAKPTCTPPVAHTMDQLKRHAYWKHVPHDIVHANIVMLKRHFDDEVIYKHCQVLFYPKEEIEACLKSFKRAGARKNSRPEIGDSGLVHLDFSRLNDSQILSLVLYTMERKFHFTGDGIWGSNILQKQQVRA